jgi:hypothetical protein
MLISNPAGKACANGVCNDAQVWLQPFRLYTVVRFWASVAVVFKYQKH